MQPRALFESFDDGERQRLFSDIAAAMQGVPADIVPRQVDHFACVHPDYTAGVVKVLGIDCSE